MAIQTINTTDTQSVTYGKINSNFTELDRRAPRFSILAYGAVAGGTSSNAATNTQAIKDARDAAVAVPGGVVYMPAGEYWVTAGQITFDSALCSVQGEGAGTVLKAAPSQVGPVITITGGSFEHVHPHGNFRIVGEDLAGRYPSTGPQTRATQRAGLFLDSAAGNTIENVSIEKTGGPALVLFNSQCNELHNVSVQPPVGVVENNVPWVHLLHASNGNTFARLGLRYPGRAPLSPELCVGVGGAVVLQEVVGTDLWGSGDDAPPVSAAPGSNCFNNMWAEYLQFPSGSCLISCRGYNNAWNDFEPFDLSVASNATGVDFVRFMKSQQTNPNTQAVTDIDNYGCNQWKGLVLGAQAAYPLRAGVRLESNGNQVVGPRGNNTKNVEIALNATYNGIHLQGSFNAPAGVGVIDNSGNASNTWVDDPAQVWQYGPLRMERDQSLGDLRVSRTDSAQAGVQIGATRLFDVGGLLYQRATGFVWQTPSGTGRMQVDGYGDLEVLTNGRALVLRSPNGTRYAVTVSNSGVLSTALA
jgi:hypothetical protein